MPGAAPSTRGERGMALVMAMLALMVLSMLGVVLMMSVNTERKLAGQNLTSASALNIAEAGIAEATSRVGNGEIDLGLNPRGTALIFNKANGLPAVGVDTVALATAQPAGAWLAYSTPDKTPQVLSVAYKTDPARTVIYKYDPTKNPSVQTVSGNPIYVITSTGRRGNASREVVAEITPEAVNPNMKSAMCGNKDIKFTGNAWACGYNHRADTPDDTGTNGRAGVGGCNESPASQHWEVGSGNVTGLWSGGAINSGGASSDAGTPPEAAAQPGFYAGPWEAVGMTQSQFFSWVGPPQSTVPANLNGIIHLDNNATTQDQSGGWSGGGSSGSGMLYVDGDFTMNSGFTYRGLIYVEGDVKLNGHAWILGGLIVRGKSQIKFNGGATILYSMDSIRQNIAKAKGQFITLSWREL